jgi:hypothetical protein
MSAVGRAGSGRRTARAGRRAAVPSARRANNRDAIVANKSHTSQLGYAWELRRKSLLCVGGGTRVRAAQRRTTYANGGEDRDQVPERACRDWTLLVRSFSVALPRVAQGRMRGLARVALCMRPQLVPLRTGAGAPAQHSRPAGRESSRAICCSCRAASASTPRCLRAHQRCAHAPPGRLARADWRDPGHRRAPDAPGEQASAHVRTPAGRPSSCVTVADLARSLWTTCAPSSRLPAAAWPTPSRHARGSRCDRGTHTDAATQTTVLMRNMSDYAVINGIYGASRSQPALAGR